MALGCARRVCIRVRTARQGTWRVGPGEWRRDSGTEGALSGRVRVAVQNTAVGVLADGGAASGGGGVDGSDEATETQCPEEKCGVVAVDDRDIFGRGWEFCEVR